MAEFLSQNWFHFVTIAVLIGGWLVRSGAEKQRNTQLIEELGKVSNRIDDLENTMDTAEKAFHAHAGNADIHVNAMLLRLFDERFDFMKQQQLDTRHDIQRIENLLTAK
jgi:hypothetical protein